MLSLLAQVKESMPEISKLFSAYVHTQSPAVLLLLAHPPNRFQESPAGSTREVQQQHSSMLFTTRWDVPHYHVGCPSLPCGTSLTTRWDVPHYHVGCPSLPCALPCGTSLTTMWDVPHGSAIRRNEISF